MTPLALTLGDEAHTRRVGAAKMLFTGGIARPTEINGRQQTHTAPALPAAGLGSALAGAQWGWAPTAYKTVDPIHTTPEEPTPALTATAATSAWLDETIAEAGRLMGRSVDAIWAEAAREWLGRHLGMAMIAETDANNDPPPTTPAAMAAAPRRRRRWAEIDSLLADLRSAATPA